MTVVRVGFVVVALACVAGCTGSSAAPVTRLSPAAPTVTATTAPTPTLTARPVRFPPGPDNLCAPLLRHVYPPEGTGFLPRASTVHAARWCVSVGPRVQLREATGDLAALDRALHAPRPAPSPTGMACTAVGYPVFTLEVVDQNGKVSRPRLPASWCGGPAGTREALAATAYVVLSSTTPTAQ